MGDTTNVAARVQSIAGPGTIVVGEATAKTLIRTFALEPLGDVTVKGRREPVSTWRLIGPQAALRATGARPLVDRDAELDRLRAVIGELESGRGQITLLLGEAGIGKTRLLIELRSLGSERVTWLEGHCVSYGTEIVYGPLVQMLQGLDRGRGRRSVSRRPDEAPGQARPAPGGADAGRLPAAGAAPLAHARPGRGGTARPRLTRGTRRRDPPRLSHVGGRSGPSRARWSSRSRTSIERTRPAS